MTRIDDFWLPVCASTVPGTVPIVERRRLEFRRPRGFFFTLLSSLGGVGCGAGEGMLRPERERETALLRSEAGQTKGTATFPGRDEQGATHSEDRPSRLR